VRYGVYVPNGWAYGSVAAITDLAAAAESAGWDSFFVWDHILFGGEIPIVDSQIAVAAVAATTSPDKLTRIGSLVTALGRRRPWKVARELVALQELSGGRIVAGFGLGTVAEYEFASTELDSPAKRGVALDDGLDLLTRFWQGEEVTWERPAERAQRAGGSVSVTSPPFLPRPQPVPPIWIAGGIYRGPGPEEQKTGAHTPPQPTAPFRRAARFQGLFPVAIPWNNAAHARERLRSGVHRRPERPLTPEELLQAVRLSFPSDDPPEDFEVVMKGRTRGVDPPVAIDDLRRYTEVGMTTWLETPPVLASLDEARRIVLEGPPV
jgi:hypothetical protein